jgi:formate hydrogenlyase subunit 3/multisubunit Na+/H+ antiporter MnhD subunit
MIPAAALATVFFCVGWKRRRWQILMLLALSLCGLCLLNGCNDKIYNTFSSNPIQSTVTVTATGGSLQRTTTFTLTIN